MPKQTPNQWRSDLFFANLRRQGQAITYADVRIRTAHSDVMPNDANIISWFSRRVRLLCPIVSAPMDTVTGDTMAIAMAKFGGLGIIHRNLTAEEQGRQVNKVKLHLNARVDRPICVFGDETIQTIQDRREEKGYHFNTFPVLNRTGKLIGILTPTDFDLCDNPRLTAATVMTTNPITASAKTSLAKARQIMKGERKKVLPLINRKGEVVGMYVFKDIQRTLQGDHQNFNLDEAGHLRVGAAIGTGNDEIDRALRLAENGVDVIVIDTAHGDSRPVYETLRSLRRALGQRQVDIVVGNISEGDSAKRLARAGADGIKVGQGPGSICTTRIVAGIGCPQVTAVYECARAIRGSGIPVCADGGIVNSGDIAVALAIGAHSVMLGRMLAGTDEAPGKLILLGGVPHKTYRGMGSVGAMTDSAAARRRYRQRDTSAKNDLVPEGVEGAVPHIGSASGILHQMAEGLRRGMGYTGSPDISALQRRARFYHHSEAAKAESNPHDIIQTVTAPNYREQ